MIPAIKLDDRKLLIQLLSRLVAADTTNPPGNEHRAARVVIDFLRTLGIKPKKYEVLPGRTNLLWSLGKGTPEIFIAAHGDTVPVGDGWTSDPLRLVEKNGQLTGRGVVDNKGALAGLLLVTKLLQPIARTLRGTITFGMVADEEAGNTYGIDYLLTQRKIDPDLAIIPDSCGANREIGIAEKGVLHLSVTATGTQAHGSRPESGLNAFYVLNDFLAVVRSLPKKFRTRDALLGALTINVGAVHAGSVANMVPGKAEALIDIRYPPPITAKEILSTLKKSAQQITRQWQAQPLVFALKNNFPPTVTAKGHPLVVAAVQAHREIVGGKVRTMGMSGFTIAGTLRRAGIPAVTCGPGQLASCHTANESVPTKELMDFVTIMEKLMSNLLAIKK